SRLPLQLTIDIGRERNIGDDQRSRWHHVRRDLPFQDTVKLANAAPFLGGSESWLAGNDATIGGDQDVLRIAPGDVGVSGLQSVDRLVDLVGEVDAIVGREQPTTGSVADEIGNRPRADFWTIESIGAVALPSRATEEHEQGKQKS